MNAAFHQSVLAVIVAKHSKFPLKQMRFVSVTKFPKLFASKLIK